MRVCSKVSCYPSYKRHFAAVCGCAPTSQAPSTTRETPAATEGNRLNPPAWGLRLWFLMVSVLPA